MSTKYNFKKYGYQELCSLDVNDPKLCRALDLNIFQIDDLDIEQSSKEFLKVLQQIEICVANRESHFDQLKSIVYNDKSQRDLYESLKEKYIKETAKIAVLDDYREKLFIKCKSFK